MSSLEQANPNPPTIVTISKFIFPSIMSMKGYGELLDARFLPYDRIISRSWPSSISVRLMGKGVGLRLLKKLWGSLMVSKSKPLNIEYFSWISSLLNTSWETKLIKTFAYWSMLLTVVSFLLKAPFVFVGVILKLSSFFTSETLPLSKSNSCEEVEVLLEAIKSSSD